MVGNGGTMVMISIGEGEEEEKEKKEKGKESVLVVLAQNLFYNWCLFYTNHSSEI